MKILIVAASQFEVKLITDELYFVEEKYPFLKTYRCSEKVIEVLITGMGAIFTSFFLTQTLSHCEYDFVLCTGLAGSLTEKLGIGEVVNVISDEFTDLGIDNSGEFLTLFEAGYLNANDAPFKNGKLHATAIEGLPDMKKVNGVTSNISHGTNSDYPVIKNKYSAQIASTEGAAALYVCNQLQIACCQIRAVSHLIGKNEIPDWDIPAALENLKQSIMRAIQQCVVPKL